MSRIIGRQKAKPEMMFDPLFAAISGAGVVPTVGLVIVLILYLFLHKVHALAEVLKVKYVIKPDLTLHKSFEISLTTPDPHVPAV